MEFSSSFSILAVYRIHVRWAQRCVLQHKFPYAERTQTSILSSSFYVVKVCDRQSEKQTGFVSFTLGPNQTPGDFLKLQVNFSIGFSKHQCPRGAIENSHPIHHSTIRRRGGFDHITPPLPQSEPHSAPNWEQRRLPLSMESNREFTPDTCPRGYPRPYPLPPTLAFQSNADCWVLLQILTLQMQMWNETPSTHVTGKWSGCKLSLLSTPLTDPDCDVAMVANKRSLAQPGESVARTRTVMLERKRPAQPLG